MKFDLKKDLKEFYKVSEKKVSVVRVPRQKIISVVGEGNPNTSIDFKNALNALFPVAYKIKFAYKKLGKDYSVMPLEGLWWIENMKEFSINNKDNWQWKIFIVQPDFVSNEVFNSAIDDIKKEKNPLAIDKVKFETLNEGLSAQILHRGSFANEGPTIRRLHDFIKENDYSFDGSAQKHHEIYLSDIRKIPPEKLKTILRQPIEVKK